MGMTRSQILFRVRFPLALAVILADSNRPSSPSVVATIAAAIGAGGLGGFIFRGVALSATPHSRRRHPAALLALFADFPRPPRAPPPNLLRFVQRPDFSPAFLATSFVLSLDLCVKFLFYYEHSS